MTAATANHSPGTSWVRPGADLSAQLRALRAWLCWSQGDAARHLRLAMSDPPGQAAVLQRWKSWERGRVLSPVYARAVAHLVDVHLAPSSQVRTVSGDQYATTGGDPDMHRRRFLSGLSILAAATTTAPLLRGDMTAGTVDAQALEHLVGLYRIADHRHGGAAVWEDAASACRNALRLARGPVAPTAAAQMNRAAADLHNVAGFASMDAGHMPLAQRQFATAVALAGAAGDGAATARAHYCQARVHLHALDWVAADVELARAEEAARGGPPGVRAMMAASRAWAQAGRGRGTDAARSMGAAEAFLARAHDRGDQPVWAQYFTEGELAAVRGMTLLVQARTDGRAAARAASAFRAAAGSYPVGEARSSLLVRIGYGHALILARRVEEGAAVVSAAAADLGGVGSLRARDRLSRIRPDLAPYRRTAAGGALDRQLRALA